jgi:ketosteroid isomerase-like protein
MLKRLFFIIALTGALAAVGFAQNANTSNSTRQRTSSAAPNTPVRNIEEAGTPQATPTPRTTKAQRAGSKTEPSAKDIIAIVNELKASIEAANVDAVTGVYWNSPQLVLFNNNGSVTKTWEQMRKNRESSYPKLKDVKLEMRDLRVQMLGRDGAVANFLWTQSQTYDGTPETATGRTTLVLRRIGTSWKVVHAHISPDMPDPSRVLPSERTTPTATPAATPKPTP